MHAVESSDPAGLVVPLPGISRLQGSVGYASAAAPGKANEDFCAVSIPSDADGMERGAVLAVADGVSGAGSARVAAEATVRSLVRDYYATSREWSVGRALDRLLCAMNDWLWAENARYPDQDSVVCAVSLVVLRAQRYYLAHVGDTRVYRARGAVFQQLTTDHTWQRRDMRHVLRRAVGLDRRGPSARRRVSDGDGWGVGGAGRPDHDRDLAARVGSTHGSTDAGERFPRASGCIYGTQRCHGDRVPCRRTRVRRDDGTGDAFEHCTGAWRNCPGRGPPCDSPSLSLPSRRNVDILCQQLAIPSESSIVRAGEPFPHIETTEET